MLSEGITTPTFGRNLDRREWRVGALLLVLLLIIILGAAGFALKLLWILALILLAIWLIGFAVRGAEGARWYRW